jgi:site-specific DNA-methyltransferase (adenine-specific)
MRLDYHEFSDQGWGFSMDDARIRGRERQAPGGRPKRRGTANSACLEAFTEHARKRSLAPLLLEGEARSVLAALPAASVDCVMTSPPYWGKRQYAQGGIGLESDYRDFVCHLAAVFLEVKRVLKPQGSLWLNVGDSYARKGLLGIPWRLALELTDTQGWILRNSVIWNKVKSGMDNSADRLGNVHEHVFHFVQQAKGYYYDANAIRSKVRQARVVNGAVISATGVSGVRYKRQIELSTALTPQEKLAALGALTAMLAQLTDGRLADFRMIIRGQQRTTHSDSEQLSGRAKELRAKGFCFLRYHPGGAKPTDVWNILPEDTQNRTAHFAPYPVELCLIPILATCPKGGIVLDPFCGTGTTLLAARDLGRSSVGIDVANAYLALCKERCGK